MLARIWNRPVPEIFELGSKDGEWDLQRYLYAWRALAAFDMPVMTAYISRLVQARDPAACVQMVPYEFLL